MVREGLKLRRRARPTARRSRRALLTSGLLVLGLSALGSGVAASVAGAQATVATNDYGHWVIADWQWRLSLPLRASKQGSCISRAQHGPMWFLTTGEKGRNISVKCAIPAGRSIMLNAPSVECSTVGPAALRPAATAALQRCAKRQWDRHPGGLNVSLDGRALVPAGYIIATDAFAFTQPARGNLTHTAGHTHGLAAVYGSASILGPLSSGTHTLVERLVYSNTAVAQQVTYHLTVG